MSNPADWTDEKVELLKKLWAGGWSVPGIAVHLGGISTNSVIGKVHRLGLEARRKSPSEKPKPRRHRKPSRIMASIVPPTIPIDMPPEPEASLEIIPLGHRCSLLELTDSTCKWPINDPPKGEEFLFCGAKTIEGCSYCGYHSRMAYRPAGEVNMWKVG